MVEIRDDDAFTITLADDAHPCIVYPAALFEKAWCPRDTRALTEAPKVNPDSRMLALGSVRADDHGATALATVVLTATRFPENSEPGNLDEFARGMADGLVKSRPGSKLLAPPHAKFVTLGGLHTARITFDIDGLSPQGLDHVISYAAWSDAGDYNITLMSAPLHAAAVDALADQAAATIHVLRPAPIKTAASSGASSRPCSAWPARSSSPRSSGSSCGGSGPRLHQRCQLLLAREPELAPALDAAREHDARRRAAHAVLRRERGARVHVDRPRPSIAPPPGSPGGAGAARARGTAGTTPRRTPPRTGTSDSRTSAGKAHGHRRSSEALACSMHGEVASRPA